MKNNTKYCKTDFPFYVENDNRFMICENVESGGKYWRGRYCNNYTKVDANAKSVLCSRCVQLVVDTPKERPIKNTEIKRARGWKLMKEYVDVEGNVFFSGVEQVELKGTLPATIIAPTQKKSKQMSIIDSNRKDEISLEIRALKKKFIAERDKTVIKKLSTQIHKLETEFKAIK